MKKYIVLVFLLLILYSLNAQITTVHFIDVGQGDCTFIDHDDFEILIDAGNNQYGKIVSDYIKEYIQGNLDIVVATHPDADHIGGLDTVLMDYSVGTIIDSGKVHTTKTYKDYMQAVFNELGVIFLNDSNMKFELGRGVSFKIIEIVDGRKDNNENSVISMLTVHDLNFLFTADLEANLEINYLHLFSDIDVLKVGHHGSNTSTSDQFIKQIKPEFAIISCGKNNRYGHPHAEVLRRLENHNATVYRTDTLGTIIATVDKSGVLSLNY